MKTCISKNEYMVMYNIVGAAMEVYNMLGREWKNLYTKRL